MIRARSVIPIALAAAWFALASPQPSRGADQLLAPRTASAFRVRTVDGRTLELAALLERGPVLLDFWATWCKPCIASMPELQALHTRWAQRGLTVIGISEDGPRNASKVRPFASRLGLGYAIVL
ncbi:MAG: TlpA family protein disulfide reductase, partial [Candidatus Eisenbacteria bacterium]|nr:TlpA family protein disulfide reductase [Candidatus Eisenbacteria bacterium]